MRQSLTAVIERNTPAAGEFKTEPYEVGWASEARWFLRLNTIPEDRPRIEYVTQISPDGLVWCDLDGSGYESTGEALISASVQEFGNWLRIRGTIDGVSASTKLTIYLALKS